MLPELRHNNGLFDFFRLAQLNDIQQKFVKFAGFKFSHTRRAVERFMHLRQNLCIIDFVCCMFSM